MAVGFHEQSQLAAPNADSQNAQVQFERCRDQEPFGLHAIRLSGVRIRFAGAGGECLECRCRGSRQAPFLYQVRVPVVPHCRWQNRQGLCRPNPRGRGGPVDSRLDLQVAEEPERAQSGHADAESQPAGWRSARPDGLPGDVEGASEGRHKMKHAATLGLVVILILSGCTKHRAANPLPTPKAYGAQIVEVSGGKQIGGVGSKLSDPLVVQVNGADGNPVAGALVAFRCAGLTVHPPYSLSDASGQVSAGVQLAGISGSYLVLAETPKSGGGVATVNSREIALGYQEELGKEITNKYCAVCHDPESTAERVSNFDNLVPPPPHLFTDGNTLNRSEEHTSELQSPC